MGNFPNVNNERKLAALRILMTITKRVIEEERLLKLKAD